MFVAIRERLRDSGLTGFATVILFKPADKGSLRWARLLGEVELAESLPLGVREGTLRRHDNSIERFLADG